MIRAVKQMQEVSLPMWRERSTATIFWAALETPGP